MADAATLTRRLGIAVRGLALAVVILSKVLSVVFLVRWGFETGETLVWRLVFALVATAPTVVAWDWVVARDGRFAVSGAVRFAAGLGAFGLGALALFASGLPTLAAAYGAVSVAAFLWVSLHGDL